MAIFLTGDYHGNFDGLKEWCERNNTSRKDYLIVLGDAGINYFCNKRDIKLKEYLSSCPITIVCIHGNHEERPANIPTYSFKYLREFGCSCWYEQDFPNIYFPQDGTMIINGITFLVAGGAYSIDKQYRLNMGYRWFPDEQMSEENKEKVLELARKHSYDYILSHTAPLNYEPKYLFLPMIDQSTVDKTMEEFLQQVYDRLDGRFKRWFFAHYHSDNNLSDKVTLVYNDIIQIQ